MELEFGLKITHAREDLSHIQISKDSITPFFSFKETETMFILIGHLSGTYYSLSLLPSSFIQRNKRRIKKR